MRRRTLKHLCFALMSTSFSASAAQAGQAVPTTIEASNQAFVDASEMIGQHVMIHGLLRWTFENKNLFPAGSNKNNPSPRNCLPVLIENGKSALIDTAMRLDGTEVVVDGVITRAAPPGMISVPSCKQVGIDVESIIRATHR
jgi:hypothetical protein